MKLKLIYGVLFLLFLNSCSKEEKTETMENEMVALEIANLVYFEKISKSDLIDYLEKNNINLDKEIANLTTTKILNFSKEKIEKVQLDFQNSKKELETRTGPPCFDEYVKDMRDAHQESNLCFGSVFVGAAASGPGFGATLLLGSAGCLIYLGVSVDNAEQDYQDCMSKL
jgi:hypothetical protein